MDDKSKSSYHSHNKSHVVPKQELSSIMTQEIPYILKSKSSQYLTEEQDEDIKNPIKILEHLHHTINNKMQQLDKLNGQYFANQQKLFFKTFINIMDRMSNQLAQVKQKYQNIDQEINNQKQCVEMRSKLCFYRDQSLIMKKQLESIEKQLKKIRQNNVFKQNQNRILLSKLTKQVKKQQKYRHRKYSLETKLEDFDLSLLGLKRTAKNSTKNRCPSAFSSQHFNIQFQEHKKPINKQKRPMTAIQMQGQCKTLDKNVQMRNIKTDIRMGGNIKRTENSVNINNLKYSLRVGGEGIRERKSQI